MVSSELVDGAYYVMGSVKVRAELVHGAFELSTVPDGWGRWSVHDDGTIWQSTPALRRKLQPTRWRIEDLTPARPRGAPLADPRIERRPAHQDPDTELR